ncbi:uncharacterized protein LOC144659532 isoform X2 [Oculina patagonica]
MCTVVVVVNFALLAVYLLVKCAVNFIRRRWQARQDRIAAANLPPAPKKPIQYLPAYNEPIFSNLA